VHATVIRFRSNCYRANDGFFATEGSATYFFSGQDPSLYFFAMQFHQRSEQRTLTAFDFESDMGKKNTKPAMAHAPGVHPTAQYATEPVPRIDRSSLVWQHPKRAARRWADLQGLVPMSTSGFTRMLACAAGSVRGLCGGGQVAADSATLCLACMRHPIATHRFPTDRLMAGPDAGTALSSSSAS
jgi:hypothetical protein